jgi:hypothetical protein
MGKKVKREACFSSHVFKFLQTFFATFYKNKWRRENYASALRTGP